MDAFIVHRIGSDSQIAGKCVVRQPCTLSIVNRNTCYLKKEEALPSFFALLADTTQCSFLSSDYLNPSLFPQALVDTGQQQCGYICVRNRKRHACGIKAQQRIRYTPGRKYLDQGCCHELLLLYICHGFLKKTVYDS